MATVLTCYYRPKPGGLGRRLVRAVEALAERGHTVHYVACEKLPVTAAGCHFHRLPAPRPHRGWPFWLWFCLAAPPLLVAIGLRHRVTHLFAFGTLYGLLLQPAARLSRAPLAVFLRADAVTIHRLQGHRLIARLERALETPALARSRIYTVSRALAEAVRQRHPRLGPRLSVLPNDLPPGRSAPPGRDPVSTGPLALAAAGVLEKRKNQAMLLEAVAPLRNSSWHLTLYGVGPQEEELARRVEALGLRDRVHFPGWVAPEEIFGETDLLLVPSLHEGAPNVVLEAIASAVPVLASDLPEHRELLPAEALLPLDPAAWANRLAVLHADRALLTALADRQRRAAAGLDFDWDEAFCRAVLR